MERFLKDIDDGAYDGYAELGVMHEDAVNPALRSDLGLTPDLTGVIVSFVDPFASAAGLLKPRDVLLTVDGHRIGNDGTVQLDDTTLDYGEFVERKQCGERVTFTVRRDGGILPVTIPLAPWKDPFVYRLTYDRQPEYVMVGGLVFSPLSRGYLITLGGELNTPAAQHLLYCSQYVKFDRLYENRDQFVVLIGRLPHPVNSYCEGFLNQVVASINGWSIGRIQDIPSALAQSTNGFHVVRFEGSDNPLILDARLVTQADEQIQARYKLPALSHINREGAP
jgi:hypothetical protein